MSPNPRFELSDDIWGDLEIRAHSDIVNNPSVEVGQESEPCKQGTCPVVADSLPRPSPSNHKIQLAYSDQGKFFLLIPFIQNSIQNLDILEIH